MHKQVYDLPLRILHWAFTFTLLGAFVIAQTVDDDGVYFSFHMILGLTLGYILFWRIVWGFIGSKHSRFTSFPLRPSSLKKYGVDIFRRTAKVWIGHNPASAWFTILIYINTVFIVSSGTLMIFLGENDFLEEFHEINSITFVILVTSHIVGLLFHHWKHKDGIGLSMIHGSKKITGISPEIVEPQKSPLRKATNFVYTLVVLIALAMWAGYFILHYDVQRQKIKVFNQVIHLEAD